MRRTLPSPTKKSSGWLDQTPPNSAYWLKYERGLSLLGQLGMSYRVTRVSTQRCLEASLRPWLKVSSMVKPVTPGRRSYLKKPSMTFRGQVSPATTLTQNDHSKKPPQGIKKTEEKLTLISHAKMGQGELRSGSNDWMEGRWQGTQMTMPQETSPSSGISMPQRSTITTMTITWQGHSPFGSSPHWWGVVLPLPPSIVPSTNSPPITGGLWPKSIGTEQWTSSTKVLLPKLTSSNKKWRQPEWNETSAKGGLKQPRLIDMSAVSTLAKQEHDMNRTKYKATCSTKYDSGMAMDMGIHSDEECGVTGLGYQAPL